jgi:hypothetical protein
MGKKFEVIHIGADPLNPDVRVYDMIEDVIDHCQRRLGWSGERVEYMKRGLEKVGGFTLTSQNFLGTDIYVIRYVWFASMFDTE